MICTMHLRGPMRDTCTNRLSSDTHTNCMVDIFVEARENMAALKKMILLCLCLLFAFLTACGYDASRSNKYTAGDTYIALVDDSYIYMIMSNGCTTYYRQYLNTDVVKELGVINDFVLSTKGAVKTGEGVYFTAVVYANGDEAVGVYEINLATNTISEVERDVECSYDAYTFPIGECVAVAKYRYEGDLIYSYIDVYNPKNGDIYTILESVMNNESLTGEIILKACSDGEHIFALTDIGEEDSGTLETVIIMYGFDAECGGVQKEEMILIDNIENYVMQSRVNQLIVSNGYIYISNYSNLSTLGRINRRKIDPIVQGENLEFAGSAYGSILLYERGSNILVVVDSATGEFATRSIEVDDDYTIKCALLNGEDLLVVLKSAGKEDLIYRRILSEYI